MHFFGKKQTHEYEYIQSSDRILFATKVGLQDVRELIYLNLDSTIKRIPHQVDQILIPIFSSLPTLPENNVFEETVTLKGI